MVATLTTFEAILKEFYLGPVIEEINNEVHVIEMFEKATVDWQGRVAIIPVHVQRNTSGVGFSAENTALPTAGAQGYSRLQVNAKFQYGRFQITGPAISAAKSGGTGAFIGYVDAEMKKLVNDVRNSANGVSVFGNEIRGFLNQHLTGNGGAGTPQPSGGAQTNVPANIGLTPFEYTGDFTPFLQVNPAVTATWVPIRLIRMDNFKDVQMIATAGPGGAPVANPNWFVTDIDTAGGFITIGHGGNASCYYDLDDVTAGFAIGVVLRFHQAVDNAAANFGVNGAALEQLQEPSGLFSNIASNGTVAPIPGLATGNANPDAYWKLVRTSSTPPAAGEEPQLRGMVLTQTVGGLQARGALTLARMQQCLDRVHVDGDAVPGVTTGVVTEGGGITPNGGGHDHDVIMMNPTTRQQYTSLLQGTLFTDTDKARAGDGGFQKLSYSGVPLKVSRAVPRGCLIFLRKDTWCITELEAAGFADLDGNVLSRVDDRDAYEGFYRWYYNVVCKQPNCNVILVGVSL